MLEHFRLAYEACLYVAVGVLLLPMAVLAAGMVVAVLTVAYHRSSSNYFSKTPYEKGKNHRRMDE